MQGRGELEKAFQEELEEPLARARQIKEADLVVGIPFYNESATVTQVIQTVQEGVRKYYPQRRVVIVLAGAPQGEEALAAIGALPPVESPLFRLAFLLRDKTANGKGWSIRAIMEIAGELGADLVILEADLVTRVQEGETVGLLPQWVYSLWEPVRTRQVDLLLPRFTRYYMDNAIGDNLVYPIITAIYNIRVRQPLSGEMAVGNRLVVHYLEKAKTWEGDVGSYGIDVWMLTEAIVLGAHIGETCLGIKLHRPSAGKQEYVVRQVAKTLFDQVLAHSEWWENRNGITQLHVFGSRLDRLPPGWARLNYPALIHRYRQGYYQFHDVLLKHVLPEEVYARLEGLAGMQEGEFNFSARLWVEVIYALLLAYAFSRELARGDILNVLVVLFHGRIASLVRELEGLKTYLERLAPDRAGKLLALEEDRLVDEQVEEFVRERQNFLDRWEKESQACAPFIPKVTCWEFIPGVPLVLPQEVPNAEGGTVNIASLYEELLWEYRERFDDFIHRRLGVPVAASSYEVSQAVRQFLKGVEQKLEETLFPGDLSTVEGTRQAVDGIIQTFSRQPLFALQPEVAAWLVRRYPPVNLMTRWGCADPAELLAGRDPLDILALASWTEEREFNERLNEWLADYARPEHFTDIPVKALVVAHEDFPALVEMKEASALSRLTGRIVVSNLRKNTGGEFPRLRYFTMIGKNIVEAEKFSQVWREFARTKTEFGEKVWQSIEGHWGSTVLSAHNILENGHQRVLVERLQEAAEAWRERDVDLADKLELMAFSYHLALTLPDGKFIPCSAWTWASYSFKGGKGVPTPLSLHVERDWFSRELLFRYAAAVGIPAAAIENRLVELMGLGRESADLAKILFGAAEEAEEVVLEQQPVGGYQAGMLRRYPGNPILEPLPQHDWESKYVLNCGAIRLEGKIYLAYRAFGADGISRIGLAVSGDGYRIDERLPEPIFSPGDPSEIKGCEDPRLVPLDGRVYMLYTAYDGILPQIAMASISVADFVNYRWQGWQRSGLVFPGVANKDALLFPTRFNGRYAMYHRVAPSLWITYADDLSCPWPREGHKIIMGPRSGLMWDAVKIGAGSQPLQTKYGWLLIYHGVDHAYVYRLGVLLVDLQDPGKVLYRSPNFILEPGTVHEVGEKDKSWVPNVVFTCGALPKEDKETLDDDAEVLVYYGAADTVISVAEARLSELIPVEVRQAIGAKVAW